MSIYTQVHDKYGSPTHVAEFRLFNLNDCFKSCENCFYKRSGNHLVNYDEIAEFADELSENGYQLETCYLLPTDFFENKENIQLIKKPAVQKVINKFLYLGLACTLEQPVDFSEFASVVEGLKIKEVEVQINLINELINKKEYLEQISQNVSNLRQKLNGRCVFNLALNLGNKVEEDELLKIEQFIHDLSDDGILEINFTFLYNDLLPKKVKSKKLINSLATMRQIGHMYNKVEERFNERTLLRKPSFIFRSNSCHISPIIPFDEYAFIENENFQLKKATFLEFLNVFANIEKFNRPILEKCNSCSNLKVCQGKGYFIAAREYQLPCFLEAYYE
jgi:hypothetical protein